MCGGLTRALCIFRRQRPRWGEFCLIADCHRKVTWGSHHKRHIIFIGQGKYGRERKSQWLRIFFGFDTRAENFPTELNLDWMRGQARPPEVRGPLDRLIQLRKAYLS